MTLQQMRDEIPLILEYIKDNNPNIFNEWQNKANALASDCDIKNFLIKAKELLRDEYGVFEFDGDEKDYPI